MTYPVHSRTWDISTTRSLYVSLLATMGDGMYALLTKLLAQGYVLKWTSNGTTGPSGAGDTTNRITSAANFQTRAAAAAAAQSYFVVTDANNVQVLVTYQGATDDIARVSFSPTAAFALAGTPTHQPTATDERVVVSTVTLIVATTSADRLFHIWVSSDAKAFRVAVARLGVFDAVVWGVEDCTPAAFGAGVTFSPPVYGFVVSQANLHGNNVLSTYAANTRAVQATPTVASVAQTSLCSFSSAAYLSGTPAINITGVAQLQNDALIYPMGLISNTAGSRGKLGNLKDWWTFGGPSAYGETVGFTNQFITMNNSAAATLWPWNGTRPVMT